MMKSMFHKSKLRCHTELSVEVVLMSSMARYSTVLVSLTAFSLACFGTTTTESSGVTLTGLTTAPPHVVVAEPASSRTRESAPYSEAVVIITPTPVLKDQTLFSPTLTILPTVEVVTGTPTPFADPLSQKLKGIDLRVNIVRELSTNNAVEKLFLSRDEMFVKVADILEKEKEEIFQEQKLLAVLGLLPNGTDLADLILGLYREGVLGLYDSEEQMLFVVQDGHGLSLAHERTYVHEFVHHLQQQAFDIEATISGLKHNQDAELAFRALVEGDSSLAEAMYVQRYMSATEAAASQTEASSELINAFYAAPRTLQRSFLFPYVEGLEFVKALYIRGGWDFVSQSFDRIPQSTEQIIHPQKYLETHEPIIVKVPDMKEVLGDGWVELVRNTMGELFIQGFLESGVSTGLASQAAAGWGGDQFVLLDGPGEDDDLFATLIIWDTKNDAKEFFEAISLAGPVIFSDRFPSNHNGKFWEPFGEEGLSRRMILSDSVVSIRLDSEKTVFVIAPDVASLDIVQNEFILVGFAEP